MGVKIWEGAHRCVCLGCPNDADTQQEIEFVRLQGPNGAMEIPKPVGITTVKLEAGEAGPSTSTEPAIPETSATGEEPINVLVPKKKRARRSPSEDDEIPPAPPPMRTIRLERALVPEGQTLDWNILDDARDQGMVDVWGQVEEDKDIPVDNVMELDAPAGSMGQEVIGLGLGGDLDAEEMARRFDEKYEKQEKQEKRKAKVSRGLSAGSAR